MDTWVERDLAARGHKHRITELVAELDNNVLSRPVHHRRLGTPE